MTRKIILLVLLIVLQSFGQFKPFSFFNSGKTLTPDAIQYKRLIDSVGGSITAADLIAFSTFTSNIISIRSKIIRFNPHGGNSLQTSLIPALRGTGIGIFYGNALDISINWLAGDYTRNTGFGDLSNVSKYLNTGLILSNIAELDVNSVGVGFFGLTNRTSSGVVAVGVADLSNNSIYLYLRLASTGDQWRLRMDNNAAMDIGTVTTTIGFSYGSRTASNLTTMYFNGISQGTNITASTGKPNLPLYVYTRNNQGSPSTYENIKSSGYIITKGLTASEQLILYNAWNKLRLAWGR